MDLRGVVAIVTGAASGLGEATARALAERGARVVVADVDAERGPAVASQIGGVFVRTDVRDEADARAVVDAAADLGELRLVANIAGGGSLPHRMVSRDGRVHGLEGWDFTLALNLTGPFNLMRFAAARMREYAPLDEHGSRGAMVNCASIAGWDGAPGLSAYAAAKAGLQGLTLSAAREFSHFGIRVNCVIPGFFATPALVALQGAGHGRGASETLFPRRLGEPAEFASLVVHLAENEFINAQLIRIDGGFHTGNDVR